MEIKIKIYNIKMQINLPILTKNKMYTLCLFIYYIDILIKLKLNYFRFMLPTVPKLVLKMNEKH